jgi:hypothetical protein
VAEEVIDRYSWLAAANALNPILGLDIKVDLSIFASMTRSLAEAYDLSDEQFQELQDRFHVQLLDHYDPLRHITGRLAPYVACKTIALTLQRIGLDILSREAAKWVPVAGTAIAARLGYRMFARAGEQLRQECEEAASMHLSSTAPPVIVAPATNARS